MATRAQRVTAWQLDRALNFDNEEDLQKYLEDADYKLICEMFAAKNDGSTNIAVFVEKIDRSSFSTETYLDAVKQQLQSTSDSVTFGTESKRDIGEQEFLEMPYVVTLSKNGFIKSEKSTFFCILQYNLAICLTLTYNDEAGLEDLLSGFSAL